MSEPLRVLFFTRYPEAGASSRYRVFQYLPHFPALGVEATVQSFMDEPMYRLSFIRGRFAAKLLATLGATLRRLMMLRHLGRFDIVYMQREFLPFGPPLIERWMKRRGVRLFFDLDDALFIAKPSRFNPLATLLRAPDKVSELFGLVDCVVAGNDWLRDQAIKAGGHAVTVEVAEDTHRIPMRARHSNLRPLTIGWLGSTSTVKYLRAIEPALRAIAARHPELRFELVGSGEFEMPGVAWQVFEWSPESELAALARFDIGLMPLPDEPWARGKSGGKARTYMAAGVVAVCSAVGYNRQLIDHQRTGWLCREPGDWEAAIERLIGDAGLRQRLAGAAREQVARRFRPRDKAAELAALFVARPSAKAR